jgi:hypothetical protein
LVGRCRLQFHYAEEILSPRLRRPTEAEKGNRLKAVQYREYGSTDVLSIVEIDAPHAGPDQIRIAVRAAGVNPLDWKLRSGIYRDFMPIDFPSGVGGEAAGIVDEVGPASQTSRLEIPFSATRFEGRQWLNRRY